MYSPTQEELWLLYNNILLQTQTENTCDDGSFLMTESLSDVY